MEPEIFFSKPQNTIQKQYEALRAFYLEKCPGNEVAERFGYTLSAFYSLTRDFKKRLTSNCPEQHFFISRTAGRKPRKDHSELDQLIIGLRKKYLSVPDIKAVLDTQGQNASEGYIYNILIKEGFSRLPRRQSTVREKVAVMPTIEAPKSVMLVFIPESFTGQNSLGMLCLLPYIQRYGIVNLIENSNYPETNSINRLSSILCFVALKLSNIRRYSADDLWCMDRGLGLFSGLNVLPKTGWYSSYSHRATRSMNRDFLKGLNRILHREGLLSDTANIDFTTIPYWGDDDHLENNWSGTRNKALASLSAVLAQDPDSGIITYGDTTIRHGKKNDVAVEFLDFYTSEADLKYLVFDSKFTTYKNLAKLGQKVKFLTIRRRGKKIVEELNQKPSSSWKRIRVMMANGKGRNLRVNDTKVFLKDYGSEVRQIAITGHGKIKPALLITNDFDMPRDQLVRKYARRWLVEKCISEQIEFFHLNRVSSSMVIKVDFDLTMSILAHNILRLFAMELSGYSHNSDYTLYKKFLSMTGNVQIEDKHIKVSMKKKRDLPLLLTAMKKFASTKIKVFDNRTLLIDGGSTS